MPAISVIVPVYNVEKYLARCLDSILNQTFTDFEVICVNDGSKDGSLTILQKYAQKDARILVLEQENQGLSMARNNGMKVAQGRYISFVDSDDAIEKQCLEIAYNIAIDNSADMVMWDYQKVDEENQPSRTFITNKIHATTFSIHERLQNKTVKTLILPMPWLFLYKKSFIQNETFIPNIYHEDEAFIYNLLTKNPKIIYTPTTLYLYTYNTQSIMGQQTTTKHISSFQIVINYLYSQYTTNASKNLFDYMIYKRIPCYINMQYIRITNALIPDQLPLWMAFEDLLRDLDAKNLLPAYDKKQKKHFRVYNYILQYGAEAYYQNKVLSWRKNPLYTMRTRSTKTYYIFGMKIFAKEKLSIEKRAIHIFGLTFTYTKK